MRYFLAFLFISFSFLSTVSMASPKTLCLASSQNVSTQILQLAGGGVVNSSCNTSSDCEYPLVCKGVGISSSGQRILACVPPQH